MNRYHADGLVFTVGKYRYTVASTYDPKDLERNEPIDYMSWVQVDKIQPNGELEDLGSVNCTKIQQPLINDYWFEYLDG